MRIIPQRNTAFKNQPAPLAGDRIKKVVRSIRARGAALVGDIEILVGIGATGNTTATRLKSRAGDASKVIRVGVKGVNIGRHVLPSPIPSKQVKPRGNKSQSFSRPLVTPGFLPIHLDRRPTPRAVPKSLAIRRSTKSNKYRAGGSQPTTIFPPDDRRAFFDTSYPWSCCGRVDVPGGSGSGVMVGPRHLLTVSHAIQWNGDGPAGPVQFRPMLFDSSAPFGEAWGMRVYFKRKISDETLGWIDEQYDYVVVVLDRRIGDTTGWMGSRGYTDDWDHGTYWSHVGYPADIGAALRPTFQTDIALDGIWYELDSHEAMSHSADVWPGQSGGPFFGWWAGENWPSVVAVQSTQNSSENKASGGQDLVDLIIKATGDFP